MTFKDHFSRQAEGYAKHRPVYPPALFDYLAELVPRHDLAWDCGTGNGQAALGLAAHFKRVIATDPSATQIDNAVAHAKVEYRVAPAEASGLDDASVDLVTVAQALHWFDHARFYAEARRVLRPHGVLAAWCYGLCEVAPGINAAVRYFCSDVVGPYWPAERRHIDERYASIEFPFSEIETPGFQMEVRWSLEEFIGYLDTWSATQRYREARGRDPLTALRESLQPLWGTTTHIVRWPIHLRAGRVGV